MNLSPADPPIPADHSAHVTPGAVVRTLLFDLDGTLTDPFLGISLSMRHALATMGHEGVDDDRLRACIGPPLRESFRDLLGCDETATIERAVAAYRERYFALGLFENVPYEEIKPALESLRHSGHRLRVVTSKVRPAAERIIEHFGLGAFFDGVHGSELDGRFDDKGDLIAHVLGDGGFDARHCLMIGDRLHDVLAARRNGVRSLGVLWGYGTAEELRDAGADAICSAPNSLCSAIDELFGNEG